MKPRRSAIRFVSKGGIVTALILVAVIAGAAVKNRLDVSALSDDLANPLSNYLPSVQVVRPAPPEVRPPAEVPRDSSTTESTTGTTESRPAPVAAAKPTPVAATKSVVAAKKPALPPPRPPASSTRSSRTAAAPATPPSRPFIESGAQSSAAARAVAQTISSPPVAAVSSPLPVPSVTSAPPVAAVSSPLPVPAVIAAPQVAAASSAPAVPAPTPAPSPPSPVPAPSATPAGGLTAETRAVAVALNRYQAAFSSLDANAAHAVWPSVDVRALAKAFEQLEEQTFDLEGCDITVAGAQAEADCAGNARYITKVGNRALRVEPRRWHFKLRRTNDQWLIDAVAAR